MSIYKPLAIGIAFAAGVIVVVAALVSGDNPAEPTETSLAGVVDPAPPGAA